MTQLNVSLKNAPNSLALLSDALRAADVNMEAVSCTQGEQHTTVHMVVDDAEVAKDAVASVGEVTAEQVLEFDMKNEVGAVGNAARALGSAGVNVNYVYATASKAPGTTTVFMSVDDMQKAMDALEQWKEDGRRL